MTPAWSQLSVAEKMRIQGVWKVADYGRLELHDGALAGLWLGPNWGSGIDEGLMQDLLAHGLVLISDQEVDAEDGTQARRRCAVLTEKGAALARTPCPFTAPVTPLTARARAGGLL